MSSNHKVIFVYNAQSGVFGKAVDWAHKIISPSTYQCNLCVLTHHHLGAQKEWSAMLETLNCSYEFLHKKEFHSNYQTLKKTALPAILLVKDDEIKTLLDAPSINKISDLEELISVLKNQLKQKTRLNHGDNMD